MELRKFEDFLHERLRDPEYAAGFAATALEDGGIEDFLYAVREVAIAQGGIKQVAAKTKRGRESLYKSLSKGGNPRIKTLDDILHSLGMRIAVTRADSNGARRMAAATEMPDTEATTGARP
jgi:probable addiction module antidote protein